MKLFGMSASLLENRVRTYHEKGGRGQGKFRKEF